MIAAMNHHRYAGATLKKKWTQACAYAAIGAQLKEIHAPVIVDISWIEPNKRRDLDNISAGTKFILDGLVMAQILQNDGRKWIRGVIHRFPEIDAQNPRVEVTLAPV